eukprot:scaffold84832_cov15-Tisochrysis_lutea.AAC.1
MPTQQQVSSHIQQFSKQVAAGDPRQAPLHSSAHHSISMGIQTQQRVRGYIQQAIAAGSIAQQYSGHSTPLGMLTQQQARGCRKKQTVRGYMQESNVVQTVRGHIHEANVEQTVWWPHARSKCGADCE